MRGPGLNRQLKTRGNLVVWKEAVVTCSERTDKAAQQKEDLTARLKSSRDIYMHSQAGLLR